MKNQMEQTLGNRKDVENSKEELLISYFRILNTQGQEYILNTMDMVKDKYIKNTVCFPTWRNSEKEYIEELLYCTQNNLIYLDFYRRNKDWKKMMEEERKKNTVKQHGGIENAKTN